jgi:putative ABC transport system permease protein
MILRRVAILTGRGLAAGVVFAAVLARLLASLLYRVRPGDPVVFASVVATIGRVAMLASWEPARKVARMDPVEALRDQ